MKMGHCKTTSATYLMILTSLCLLWAPTVSSSFGTLFQFRQAKSLAVSTGFANTANMLATSAVAQWINQHRALTITTTVAAIGLIAAFASVVKKYRNSLQLSIPPAPPVPPIDPAGYVRPIPQAPPVPIFIPFTVDELNATLPATVQGQGQVSRVVQQPTENMIPIPASPTPIIATLMHLQRGPLRAAPQRPIVHRVTTNPSSSTAASSLATMSSVSDAQRVRVEQQQKEEIQKQQTLVPQQEIDSWLGLSANNRTVRLQQLTKWYEAGRQLFRSICSDQEVHYVPNQEDLRNLTWFFYLYAGMCDARNFFEEGTFRIIGSNQQHECKYLTAIYEAFEEFANPRLSTHLKEYQHKDFGIDIAQLPAQKAHLLFGWVPEHNFLYLKPENYGVTGVKNGLLHLWELAVAQVRKTPLAKLLGMRSDSSEGWRKERAEILDEAKPLLNRIIKLRGLEERPRKTAIKDYIDFLTKVLQEVSTKDEALGKEIATFINHILEKHPDSWRERIGNEVILSVSELLNAPDIVIDGDFLRIRR